MHTSSFSPPPLVAGAVPGTCSVEAPACATSSESGSLDVSAVRQAENELDEAIADLKTLAALALDSGDESRAIEYSRRLMQAVKSRSPEHQDRLARAHLAMVERSLDRTTV